MNIRRSFFAESFKRPIHDFSKKPVKKSKGNVVDELSKLFKSKTIKTFLQQKYHRYKDQ